MPASANNLKLHVLLHLSLLQARKAQGSDAMSVQLAVKDTCGHRLNIKIIMAESCVPCGCPSLQAGEAGQEGSRQCRNECAAVT
jgi:hypothetical protein